MAPKTLSVSPRQPKHAWSDSEDAACLEQSVSPHLSSRWSFGFVSNADYYLNEHFAHFFLKCLWFSKQTFISRSILKMNNLSEKSEKILKEWYVSMLLCAVLPIIKNITEMNNNKSFFNSTFSKMATLVTLANFYFRGITNDATALLMLKRAKKLKGRKQQEKRLLGRHIHPSIHTSIQNVYS